MTYFVVMVMTLIMTEFTTSYRKVIAKNRTLNNMFVYELLIWLTAIPCILVSGLRAYTIGTDTRGTYYYIFLNVYSNGISGIRDIGYALVNQLSLWITDSYSGVLILTSMMCCGIAMHAIFKQSQNPVMSCLLFFTTNVFFISMNMVRQSIAIMIFIVAIPYMKEQKFAKYMLLILLAASIHAVSIIYLVLFFICQIKMTKTKVVGGCFGVLVVGNMLAGIFEIVVRRVTYLSKYFSWYFTSSFNSGAVNWFSLMVELAIVVFLLFIYNSAKNDGMYRIVLWLNFIALSVLLISSRIPLAQRISWLFSFPNFVYLPQCINYIKNPSNRKIVSVFVNLLFFVYMFITIFMRGYHDVVPYASIIGQL